MKSITVLGKDKAGAIPIAIGPADEAGILLRDGMVSVFVRSPDSVSYLVTVAVSPEEAVELAEAFRVWAEQ